jgi:hypothetical protein
MPGLVGQNSVFEDLGIAGDTFGEQFAQGAISNTISQGIGVATGLQSKFDWTGVAAAGMAQGVGSAVGGWLGTSAVTKGWDINVRNVVSGVAGNIAYAATRSIIEGSDFGDNILAGLPTVLGNTIGNMVAGHLYGGSSDPELSPAEISARKDQYNQALDSGKLSSDQLGQLYHSLGLDTITASSAPLGAPVEVSALAPIPASTSLADRLAQEQSELFPYENDLNVNDKYDGIQFAQAGGPLAYPLRQVPIPTFEPDNIPGMNLQGKERIDNLKEGLDNMKENTETGEALREIGSRAGQVQVQSDFDIDLHSQYNTPIVQFRQSYYVGSDSLPPVGKGNTWLTPDGKYYVDRNGDTHPDIEIRYSNTGKASVNYGDGRGFIPFNRKTYVPPPDWNK